MNSDSKITMALRMLLFSLQPCTSPSLRELYSMGERPCCFTSRERVPNTHWIGGWVGPRASLDVEKRKISCPYQASNPPACSLFDKFQNE
jgi:hypothetical protein